uniref:Putative DNA recombination protein n=1 Tax=viral metagenome TaxID=1070528 RepID=A0A6M3LG72_9ZZZZ
MNEKKNALEIKKTEQDKIVSLLKGYGDTDSFIASAKIYFDDKPELLQTTRASQISALYQVAQLGLDFVDVKGFAYLVKFGDRCVPMIGYRGLIDILMRTKKYKKIEARLVYANDECKISFGTKTEIVHMPVIGKSKGNMVGVYAVALTIDDIYYVEWMDNDDIEDVRKHSKKKDGAIWTENYGEMAKKSVVRRLFKYLSIRQEEKEIEERLNKALELDNDEFGVETEQQEPPEISKPKSEPEAEKEEVENGKFTEEESEQEEENEEQEPEQEKDEEPQEKPKKQDDAIRSLFA